MLLQLAPTIHRTHVQRNGLPIPLAPSLEHLRALLDGAATAQDGDLPTVPSGSDAKVLAENGSATLISVGTDQRGIAIGWVPSWWLIHHDAA